MILKAPKIKAAHAAGSKGFCQLDTSIQDLILLVKGEVCAELVALITSGGI